MNTPINVNDLERMEGSLLQHVDYDRKYWVVNSIKCDAVVTAKSYEEFSDRVAAAHLSPLEKKDHIKAGSLKNVWNKAASKNKPTEEE